MLQKGLIIAVLACAALLLGGSPASAASVISINDLVEKAVEHDGQTVTVQGEAIGEVLERGEFAWVNISDGGNAIGIWMTLEDAGKISFFGDYKNRGDTLRITGVFSRNCAAHGGDVDIHSTEIDVLSVGEHIAETVGPVKIIITGVLGVIALLTCVLTLVVKKR